MRTACAITALAISVAISPAAVGAQSFAGKWVFEEGGERAVLDLRHDPATRRVTGTLDVAGNAQAVSGRVEASTVIIEMLGGTAIAGRGLTATHEGDAVVLVIQRQGRDPVHWRMTREGGAPSPEPVASGNRGPAGAPAGAGTASAAGAGTGFRAAAPNEFAGEWQAVSDDQTSAEAVELQVSGNSLRGRITVASRGYFSGRTKVEAQVDLQGTYRNGGFDVRMTDGQSGQTVEATLRVRGAYLVMLRGGHEGAAYARPGQPLVTSAEGSAEAAALARSIAGRIYSASQQAGGRGGAIAGARIRLALCADQSIAFDASDVASVPGAMPGAGGSIGETVTRRGRWSVVLLAGAPAVRADWRGTGSTYALVAYFRIKPAATGRSAIVDGMELPVTGRC